MIKPERIIVKVSYVQKIKKESGIPYNSSIDGIHSIYLKKQKNHTKQQIQSLKSNLHNFLLHYETIFQKKTTNFVEKK